MPKLRSVLFPEAGIPGLGWATWLGSEYKGVETPDVVIQRARDRLLEHIDPLVFQPEPSDLFAPSVKKGVWGPSAPIHAGRRNERRAGSAPRGLGRDR